MEKNARLAGVGAAVVVMIVQIIYCIRFGHFMSWFILGGAIVAATLVWSFINGMMGD